MTSPTTIAMTTGEAIVAVAVIVAGTALVLLVVWQLFGLARRGMELRAEQPSADAADAAREDDRPSTDRARRA